MIKLFVRLAISGTIASLIGASALADGASIQLTGPGSTNIVTSSNRNSFSSNTSNWVAPSNWSTQSASSGPVWLGFNTVAGLSGGGSGNAYNVNSGQNDVQIQNGAASMPMLFQNGGGNGGGTIFLTGPFSNNRISSSDSNRYSSNTVNNVSSTNFNSQTARSGGVTVAGNTLVEGLGGSGTAANVNSGSNTTYINNSRSLPVVSGLGSSGNGNATISTTGPGSFNAINSNTTNSYRQNTQNVVNSANFNQQNATSGNVLISGNTVVAGAGGSGAAYNSNSGTNNVAISN